MCQKIEEYLATGEIQAHRKLAAEFPPTLPQLLQVPGLGPKKVAALHRELKVTSLDDLRAAITSGAVERLSGFGKKTAEKLLTGIEFVARSAERTPLNEASPMAESIRASVAALPGVRRTELAGSLRTSWFRNTNRLLWTFEGADGVKTGTTDAAGKCLVASATRDGRRLLAVVLNSGDRWGDAARLLSYGFDQFESVVIARAGQVVRTVIVRDGMAKRLPLVAAADLIVPVRRGHAADVRLSVEAAPRPQAEVREGTVLGRASLVDGQRTLLTVNLVAAAPVQRWTIGRLLLNRIVLPLVRLLARLGVG
jgi:hypothetical protein